MNTFGSQGFQIAYDDHGDGGPIILLHGFAADRRSNWQLTGWYKLLLNAGFRVVAQGRTHLSCISDNFFKGAVLGFLGCR